MPKSFGKAPAPGMKPPSPPYTPQRVEVDELDVAAIPQEGPVATDLAQELLRRGPEDGRELQPHLERWGAGMPSEGPWKGRVKHSDHNKHGSRQRHQNIRQQ